MANETVLVVDDDQVTLELVKRILTRESYLVETTTTGEEALRIATKTPPDLVILDVMMPGLSGIQVCERLRKHPRTANTPIIMLSARGQVDDTVHGLDSGADEYITKPVAPAELVARVKALLSRTKRLLEQAARGPRTASFGFIGAKGGVGTTTMALNVAATLASPDRPVIVVEARSSLGTMALRMRQRPFRNISSLLRAAPEKIDADAVSAQLSTIGPGLRALFGPQRIEEFAAVRTNHIRAIHRSLLELGATCVFDFATDPGPAAHALVPELDAVVLVVEPDTVCVQAASVKLEMLSAWGAGPGTVRVVVVNRSSLVAPLSFAEIGEQLGCEVVGIIPQAAQAFVVAQEAGRPLVLTQPDSAAAVSIREVANRLVGG